MNKTLTQMIVLKRRKGGWSNSDPKKEDWIIDFGAIGGMRYIGRPKQPTISIYWMDKAQNEYGEPKQFREKERIDSPTFPELELTAEQGLKADW